MVRLKYRIPELQPLPPSVLLSGKSDIERHFPFSHDLSQYYYLARNAIWHGVDALGLKPGDTVVMPAYHHGIEVETLLNKGLKLKYYRIDDQMRIDFEHLESLISPEISALYVIHYIGFPQDLKRISGLIARYPLKLIEDCALSLFSASAEGPLGTFGDISIYCLYKTLAIPHGGLLVVNDRKIALPAEPGKPDWISTAAYLSNRILDSMDTKWNGLGYQFNNRLKSAARVFKRKIPAEQVPINTEELVEEHLNLGISRITHWLISRMNKDMIVKRRRDNYTYLVELLKGRVEMPFMNLPDGVCPLFLSILAEDKRAFCSKLVGQGVGAVNFWSNPHPDVPSDEFPEVNYLRNHVLELPIHQGLEEKHMEFIASKLRGII